MDGWITLPKTRANTNGVQCINTKATPEYDICMLQMFITMLVGHYCKIHVCWSDAIVTTITLILVWCKCNRQHRWLDIAITHINAMYQTCMLVGASLTDMAAG